MAKLTKVINGEQVTIEGTIEELKQFQEKGNVTSDLLSPKERLDTDSKDEELKVGDIVRFTEDSGIELEASGIHSLFLPNKEMKKGQDYLIHNYDGESYDEIMTLENIDGVSYLFTSEDERLFIPYRKTDSLLFSNINDDESDNKSVVDIEDNDDLEVGEYYEVSFIHCDYSGDSLSGKVKLKEIDEDGDYVFIDEENTVSCIIKPENLDHYIFDEIEEDEEQENNEEETEENQKKFERGNIVEVLEEVGGVKVGSYGIVLGYDSDGDVHLAGFDNRGTFSTMWFHEENGLKLIKE